MGKKDERKGKEATEMKPLAKPDTKVNLPPMAKMKQGFQEAMTKKGLTIEDVRKITGIKRYEKEN
ncbi:hypothetical protein DesLBE_0111 [Desulfitobacterium sp. LBE]|uniref:hypothetical protein n=1 Tax=Desulfitobacterium sp. LBE TaxID=884086 RepID=UPI00119C5C04|nr:hypothetical protein [Desulfitobacterium sp. LBE]TWH55934.1 hypothetical protein DesLBE_0111 [Desulfitobacterium sp. LBE]